MGPKGKNFHNNLMIRYGFEVKARMIHDLYLAGRKDEAAAAVPARLLELTSLCGPKCYVAERIAAFRETGVTHLQVDPVPLADQTARDLIATVRNLVD